MRALDSFVLTGAIKLFRESKGAKPYRHHTMLVHESVKQAEHDAVANDFKALWKSAGYSQAKSLSRLEKLWAEDFAVVSAARGSELANPSSFGELEEFIGAAYDKISVGTSPVIVVNGAAEKDYKQDSLDFQERGVWKILVGGTKLSRGFTVEGLTITYYTRRTGQADTLMQMGRWFGFRPGYRDLVRLFIGRTVGGPARRGLRHVQGVRGDRSGRAGVPERAHQVQRREREGRTVGHSTRCAADGVSAAAVAQAQRLETRLFNADLVYRGMGGESFSFTMQPPRGDGSINARHFDAVTPLLKSLDATGSFNFVDKDDVSRSFTARYGIVPAHVVLEAVDQFEWANGWDFGPHREALSTAIESGLLEDFAVLLPYPKTREPIEIKGWHEKLPIVNRKRQEREYRTGFTGTAVS